MKWNLRRVCHWVLLLGLLLTIAFWLGFFWARGQGLYYRIPYWQIGLTLTYVCIVAVIIVVLLKFGTMRQMWIRCTVWAVFGMSVYAFIFFYAWMKEMPVVTLMGNGYMELTQNTYPEPFKTYYAHKERVVFMKPVDYDDIP